MVAAEHPGADVRARTDSHLGAQPAALLRHALLEPGGAGGVHARAAPRAGAPRAVEAAPDRPARAGGARQHQGSAGHLRQGRPRDVPRRAQLHREGSAARVFRARRHAPARRSRRCLDRGRPGDFELHPVSRGRRRRRRRAPRSGSGAMSSSRSWRSTKASRWTPIACSTSRCGNCRRRRRSSDRSPASSNGGDPIAAWRKAKDEHPAPGALVCGGAGAARGAQHVHRSQRDRHAARRRAGDRGADARVLPLVVREHVGAGAVRAEGDARLLLPDRRRSVVAGRQAGRASARLQLPDAVGDLDPRGVSRALPALSVPAARRVEGAQVDHVRARVVRRRLGALLRADDGRGRVPPERSRRSSWDSSPRR